MALCLASELAAQGESGESTIESIRLVAAEGGVELLLDSSGTLRLVGVQMDPDGSLVVQLPRHLPGPDVEDLFPTEGLVSAVRLSSEQTSRGPLTRVVVQARREISHSVSSEGSLLRLRVWPQGADTPEARVVAVLRRQVTQLETSLAESEGVRAALARRSESLEQKNQTLAERFKTLEASRGELDTAMKTTLGEATELLRSLASRKQELSGQLQQAESRERELKGRLEELDGSLAESEITRQELAARLEAVMRESSELARQVSAQKARETELEAALAASREEIERLEMRDSMLARELGERLEEASGREDELRTELTVLQATLAESRAVEEDGGTWVQVRTDDSYEGWVRGDASVEDPWAEELGTESRGGPEELAAQLEAAIGGQRQLATRLDVVETAGSVSAEIVQVAGSPQGRTSGTLFLRRGAGKSHHALRVLPKGSEVRVLRRSGYWLGVRTEVDEGWISGRYFELEDGASPELGRALAAELERRVEEGD